MHSEELLYLDLTVDQTENLHCFTETLIIHVSLSISRLGKYVYFSYAICPSFCM